MNADQRISIDFGSTRTKVAFWNNETGEPALVEIGREQYHILPSVFYIPRTDGGEILVGDEAIDRLEEDPQGIVIGVKKDIHKIGKIRVGSDRPALDPVQLVAHLLQYIRDFCGENVLATKPIGCTLTVPVTFEERQINRLVEAAKLAGFSEVDTIEEPVAAAMAWLKHSSKFLKSKHVIVCDVGGGTTDLALLNYEEGRFYAHPKIETVGFDQGGNDVDQNVWERVFETLEDTKQLEYHKMNAAFRNQIRQVKELLLTDVRKSVTVDINGKEAVIDRKVIQEESEALVRVVVDETKQFVEKCQRVTGDREIPILLVGGGSRVPNLQEQLEMASGCAVYRWNFSDYATVLGAMHYRADQKVTDVQAAPPVAAVAPVPVATDKEPFGKQALIFLGSAFVALCFFASLYFLFNQKRLPEAVTPVVSTPVTTPSPAPVATTPATTTLPPVASAPVEEKPVVAKEDPAPATKTPTSEEISLIVEEAVKEALSAQIPAAIASVQQAQPAPAEPAPSAVEPKKNFEQFITVKKPSVSPEPSATVLPAPATPTPQVSETTSSPLAENSETFSPVRGGKKLVPDEQTSAPASMQEKAGTFTEFYVEGTVAEESGLHKQAFQWFMQGAEAGDIYSMHKLGMSYINGKGVPRNYSEALRWFETAATRGLAESQVYLGFVYEFGFGVRKDKDKARYWYEQAAEQNNQEAIEYLRNL